jgi:hypothetical protein
MTPRRMKIIKCSCSGVKYSELTIYIIKTYQGRNIKTYCHFQNTSKEKNNIIKAMLYITHYTDASASHKEMTCRRNSKN